MTAILLVEDHELMRHGARKVLLDAFPGATIGEAGSSAEANQLLAASRWDLVVLDLNLPGRSGLELLEEIGGLRGGLRVLVLSAASAEEVAVRCIRLGAAGFLAKASAATELVAAVRKILAGGRYVSAAVAEILANELGGSREQTPHEALSPRELQVLKLVARGRSLKEIGAELHLSERTVATYRARIGEKLELSRAADLVRYAVRYGLVD